MQIGYCRQCKKDQELIFAEDYTKNHDSIYTCKECGSEFHMTIDNMDEDIFRLEEEMTQIRYNGKPITSPYVFKMMDYMDRYYMNKEHQ